MIGYLCVSVTSGPKNPSWWIRSWRVTRRAKESVFLSALNASLAHFVHKTLKDEQVECIRMGEMFWPCYRRDSARASSISWFQSIVNLGRTANAISKTTVAGDYIRKQQVSSIEKVHCGICAAAIGEWIQGDSEIKNGKFDIVFGSAEQWLSDRWRKALQFGALHRRKVLVVDEVHTVATL